MKEKFLIIFNFAVFIICFVMLIAFCSNLLEGEDTSGIKDYSFLIALGLIASVCVYNLNSFIKK